MRRGNLLAVVALAPVLAFCQVRPDYPKTPGEVVVAGKPMPITAFWSSINGSSLRYVTRLDGYLGFSKFQRLPLFDIKTVLKIEFLPFSDSEISTLKKQQNDFCKDPAQFCDLRRATVTFRSSSGRKALEDIYVLLGLGTSKVYGFEGEEYALTDRDVTAVSFK